jgi:hypothetical protein
VNAYTKNAPLQVNSLRNSLSDCRSLVQATLANGPTAALAAGVVADDDQGAVAKIIEIAVRRDMPL